MSEESWPIKAHRIANSACELMAHYVRNEMREMHSDIASDESIFILRMAAHSILESLPEVDVKNYEIVTKEQ